MADKTWSSEEDTVEKADRNNYPADDSERCRWNLEPAAG